MENEKPSRLIIDKDYLDRSKYGNEGERDRKRAAIINTIVLSVICERVQGHLECGMRTLIDECNLADKTITKAINMLERDGRIQTSRTQGLLNEYEILIPPTELEQIIARIYLEKIS